MCLFCTLLLVALIVTSVTHHFFRRQSSIQSLLGIWKEMESFEWEKKFWFYITILWKEMSCTRVKDFGMHAITFNIYVWTRRSYVCMNIAHWAHEYSVMCLLSLFHLFHIRKRSWVIQFECVHFRNKRNCL